jgi:threonine/homoserine/homoserine lactone efflux protein
MPVADYLPQLLLAWSIQTMGVLSPGPSVMLILGVAMGRGRLPALVTAFGVACGSIILSSATVLGITVIFADIAGVMTAIRLIGAAYLLWLAWKAFQNALNAPELNLKQAKPGSAWRAGLSGFLLQISNPKAIFFWLAIASVGGVGDAPAHVVALFVGGAFVNSFVGHGGYALLLSSGPVRRLYFRFRRWIDAALGSFFVFAVYTLAISR